MAIYGFHASHEQVAPGDLLDAVRLADEAGFAMAMCSDHIAPWSARQGESGFAWSWLGAALQATTLRFGVVNAPGQRYHPAIVAQAIGTLAAMFPGRFWAALGSGEASNEHVTGDQWPRKEIRQQRLRECVDVIRALLDGEEVSHDGLVKVDRAKLWSLPAEPPKLIGAAVSVETARWVAEWADGLITVNSPRSKEVLDAYREAGGRGPAAVQVHLSWAPSDDEALAIAHDQWKSNVVGPPGSWDFDTPEMFDSVARFVTPDEVAKSVLVSSDTSQHTDWLRGYAEAGFDEVYLHHVGQEQTRFIETFGAKVLPELTTG
ncbi:TIGR03885 family FMN-dependent LLM class oxidoreductase [Herbidospora mongoliensis]|uniref:TIGR03885 family FMN-dependent LLM class oxidoreductase n=1 Tax=Herbidospora mongoliensis TaxID=688067 RepID=UPI0008338698|nr:TIGR03885 family FMN-dependent LLM class oxidoreductase [Herbidospora mongoliensis]